MTSAGCFKLLRPEQGRARAETTARAKITPHDDFIDWGREGERGVGTLTTTVVPPFKPVHTRWGGIVGHGRVALK